MKKRKKEETNRSREKESLEDFVSKLHIVFLSPDVDVSAVAFCCCCCCFCACVVVGSVVVVFGGGGRVGGTLT